MEKINKKIYCATPAPLLWKGLFFVVPALVVILIVLVSQALIRMYSNKKHNHKKIIDKPVIILTIWSIVAFLSLISYGIIGLDFNYYLLEFFLLTVFMLGAFFVGEYFHLYKIARSRWIFMATLSIVFAVLFSVCFVNAVKQDAAFAKGAETQCFNRLLF